LISTTKAPVEGRVTMGRLDIHPVVTAPIWNAGRVAGG
jgi:hypothetical protein